MLTAAQYKALKTWPDSGGYVRGVSEATCRCLVAKWLFKKIPSSWHYKKLQTACNNAIREYEAAHYLSNQANLSDVPETNFGDIPGHKETLK